MPLQAAQSIIQSMAPIPAECLRAGRVLNFAFGSNLSSSKMSQRGLIPKSTCRVKLPGWRLVFNQLGYPPIEPSFASITPDPRSEVHGLALELSVRDFEILWRGEGGNEWQSVEVVTCHSYEGERLEHVLVFRSRPEQLTPAGVEWPCSARYKALLVDGAREAGLDKEYQERLQAVPTMPRVHWLQLHLWQQRLDVGSLVASHADDLPVVVRDVVLRLERLHSMAVRAVGRRLMGTQMEPLIVLAMVPSWFVMLGPRLWRFGKHRLRGTRNE
mmetsp:Transcript_35831/g.78445  ORF Transcript_35831/g.78445 Transcript_35831/m.78445 type:complete len:272 (-) Transcript_35831:190-1005(-)